MTLFPGITQRVLDIPGLAVGILERVGDDPAADPAKTVVFVHGNVSSSLFFMPTMLDLPNDLRVIAIDLRGYGATRARARRRHSWPAGLQRRHPRDPRGAGDPGGPPRRLVNGRGGRDAVRARPPRAEPHPGGAGVAVRLRRHPARRVTADRRRRGHRRRHRESRLRAAPHRQGHHRRGADLAAQRLPCLVRGARLRDRARGRLGRVHADDLHCDGQLPRRLRALRRTGRVSPPDESAF